LDRNYQRLLESPELGYEGVGAAKEKTVDETSNLERTEKAFRYWQDGTAPGGAAKACGFLVSS